MKILNVCSEDWANFSYTNMQALRSVGLQCDSIKRMPHQFYQEQSEIVSEFEEMKERIRQYDVIQFFHDNNGLFIHLEPAMAGKKIIAYHTSSHYRRNYAAINSTMNKMVFRSVNAMPEFMGRGAKNEVYMVGAVDTDRLLPPKEKPEYKFAHFPSSSTVKGTSNILNALKDMEIDFSHSTYLVSYEEQIKRMSKCQVYIEMLTKVDGSGSPYGCFGITALEAAALGKIVITQNNHGCEEDPYYKAYGYCGLNFAKDEKKLKRLVETFDNYEGDFLKGQQDITREWVVANHSYMATGEYFLKNVLNE